MALEAEVLKDFLLTNPARNHHSRRVLLLSSDSRALQQISRLRMAGAVLISVEVDVAQRQWIAAEIRRMP